VPGLVFLSGGQSEIEATRNLNAINSQAIYPWALSFSFGRALQQTALRTWRGNPAKRHAAQAALLHRAKMSSRAC
ncbi:MAG: class I fructose-bisphosphate aldolase, partial [Opitutales bacterium]